jgi:hypothetical protein
VLLWVPLSAEESLPLKFNLRLNLESSSLREQTILFVCIDEVSGIRVIRPGYIQDSGLSFKGDRYA